MSVREELDGVLREVIAVKDQLAKLAPVRVRAQEQLSDATHAIRTRGRMSDGEYRRLCDEQHKARNSIRSLESRTQPLKSKLRELSLRQRALEAELREDNKSIGIGDEGGSMERARLLNARVIELRSKYMEFASDATRVSSMRLMASQFADDLTAILKEVS